MRPYFMIYPLDGLKRCDGCGVRCSCLVCFVAGVTLCLLVLNYCITSNSHVVAGFIPLIRLRVMWLLCFVFIQSGNDMLS